MGNYYWSGLEGIRFLPKGASGPENGPKGKRRANFGSGVLLSTSDGCDLVGDQESNMRVLAWYTSYQGPRLSCPVLLSVRCM